MRFTGSKAVSPMQACALHLCHRTPRRWRACVLPDPFVASQPCILTMTPKWRGHMRRCTGWEIMGFILSLQALI
jgi:hypothetical protein